MRRMDSAGKAARKAVASARRNGNAKKVAAVAAAVVAGAVATGAMIRRA